MGSHAIIGESTVLSAYAGPILSKYQTLYIYIDLIYSLACAPWWASSMSRVCVLLPHIDSLIIKQICGKQAHSTELTAPKTWGMSS